MSVLLGNPPTHGSQLARTFPVENRRNPSKRPLEYGSIVLQNLSHNLPVVAPCGNSSTCYNWAKRVIDIFGAATLIVLFLPLLLVVFTVLCVTTKGRPMFIQQRIGYLGRRFPMIKFRTMCAEAEQLKHVVENQHSQGPIFKNRSDPRVTRLGRILRRTSIDEMPQLFNVLVGQMSLVGPRPPVVEEVKKYAPWQLQRLSVRPGLTCLWQVSGRSEIGFDDWVRMDIWYLRNQGLLTDLKLLAATPCSVLSGKGAY